jgi:hypothetical protein
VNCELKLPIVGTWYMTEHCLKAFAFEFKLQSLVQTSMSIDNSELDSLIIVDNMITSISER